MRSAFTRATFLVTCLGLASDAIAHEVMLHELTAMQFGPRGEILVSGTMGSMLSTDGGEHWTQPVPSTHGSSAAAPSGNSIERLAGTFALEWAKEPESTVPAPAVDKRGRRYACSKDRMHVDVSDDGGKDWRPMEPLDKSDPGRQTIANGVSMITDINGRYRELRDVAEIRSSSDRDECGKVTMIADIPYVLARNGIYHSEDRGVHWTGQYHFLGAFPATARLFGDSKGTLYVNQAWPWRTGDDHLRVYRSADQGATWERMTFNFSARDLSGDMALLQIRDDTLYFALHPEENGLVSLCTSADGKTAIRLLDFERRDGFRGGGLDFFDIGPRGELGVLGSQSLFISGDHGRTWRLIDRDALMKAPWGYIAS